MQILILLKREFFIFFKNIHINLLIYFLFPIFIYLFIVAPFSNLFSMVGSSGMNYSYHSIPAIIFVCTSILAFIIPIIIVNRDYEGHYLSYMFTSGISHVVYSLFIIVYAVICAYIQFVITFLISIQLSSSGINLGVLFSWEQILYFFIIIFPSILFFSNLGLLFSNFLKRMESILVSVVFLFLVIAFGSCSFIPGDYYSNAYSNFVYDYNIIFQLYNMFIMILKNENISSGTFIISILLAAIFYFLNLFFLKKTVKNY